MRVEGRSLTILVILALITIPAAVLRVFCVGRSCEREARSKQSVPFCSLPADVRRMIAAGYREGRSPEVLAVSNSGISVVDETHSSSASFWPSIDSAPAPALVIFTGTEGGGRPEPIVNFGLDDVAPTIAKIIRFAIPHPEVRSGKAATEVASGDRPRLVVLAVFRNFDPDEEMKVPNDLSEDSVSASATAVSLPWDPAAFLATIGTGGTPSQHGVTGSVVRNDRGDLVRAWSGDIERSFVTDGGFPGTVIATVSDDLDDVLGQKPKIGLVGESRIDQGLIGGNWYVDVDQDERLFVADPVAAIDEAGRLMRSQRFGRDHVPDVLAVSVESSKLDVTNAMRELAEKARKAAHGEAALVSVGLPVVLPEGRSVSVQEIVRYLESQTAPGVVEEVASGGLFLDQQVLADRGITKDQVVTAMRDTKHNGKPVFADVFPGIAVSFARFC